jgi:hypothetical protein
MLALGGDRRGVDRRLKAPKVVGAEEDGFGLDSEDYPLLQERPLAFARRTGTKAGAKSFSIS